MGTTISYAATRRGYTVQTCVDGVIEDEYNGGNCPYAGEVRLHPDEEDAIPLETLKEYARKTALETADELGVPHEDVFEDDDLKTALEDNEPLKLE